MRCVVSWFTRIAFSESFNRTSHHSYSHNAKAQHAIAIHLWNLIHVQHLSRLCMASLVMVRPSGCLYCTFGILVIISWQSFPFFRRNMISVLAYIAICSISLWLYSFLLGLGRFFNFLIFYTVGTTPWTGISPSQGSYLHTGQHRHRTNEHRHPCLEWDSNPRSQCLGGRRQFMPCGYCGRRNVQ
jgi:hypothetical protein